MKKNIKNMTDCKFTNNIWAEMVVAIDTDNRGEGRYCGSFKNLDIRI